MITWLKQEEHDESDSVNVISSTTALVSLEYDSRKEKNLNYIADREIIFTVPQFFYDVVLLVITFNSKCSYRKKQLKY